MSLDPYEDVKKAVPQIMQTQNNPPLVEKAIMTEMELSPKKSTNDNSLKQKTDKIGDPATIVFSDAAVEQFIQAIKLEEHPENVIRLGTERLGSGKLHHFLDFTLLEEKTEKDIPLLFSIPTGELTVLIDNLSAQLLAGYSIDFATTLQGTGFKFNKPKKHFDNPTATALQSFLEDEIGPGLASHGGTIELVDYDTDTDSAHIEMGGGCQGCGQAAVTLREGVEVKIKERFPEIKEIIDRTNHEEGENPYYT